MKDNIKIIIGASGYIGGKLYQYFFKKDKRTIGTYGHLPKNGLDYFDLENPDLKKFKKDLNEVSHAIICSAITKPDDCKKNKEESYQINVTGTKKLIERLWKRNIFPIWFSSEYVFNGSKGEYTEIDSKTPNTVYGSHKAEIEDFLVDSKEPFLIARISKIFGLRIGDKTLLTSTLKQLNNNETIRCAKDQIFSPTYIEDFVSVLDLAMEKKLIGLYNIASPESYSRFQIAEIIKSQLKIKSGEIIPCSINDFDFLDSRPLNTSLNSEKIIKDTGFKFTPIEKCISKLERIIT